MSSQADQYSTAKMSLPTTDLEVNLMSNVYEGQKNKNKNPTPWQPPYEYSSRSPLKLAGNIL